MSDAYDFTLVLSRQPTPSELNRLARAGCGDARLTSIGAFGVAEFHRVAHTFDDAVRVAIIAVEHNSALHVLRVDRAELLTAV